MCQLRCAAGHWVIQLLEGQQSAGVTDRKEVTYWKAAGLASVALCSEGTSIDLLQTEA